MKYLTLIAAIAAPTFCLAINHEDGRLLCTSKKIATFQAIDDKTIPSSETVGTTTAVVEVKEVNNWIIEVTEQHEFNVTRVGAKPDEPVYECANYAGYTLQCSFFDNDFVVHLNDMRYVRTSINYLPGFWEFPIIEIGTCAKF